MCADFALSRTLSPGQDFDSNGKSADPPRLTPCPTRLYVAQPPEIKETPTLVAVKIRLKRMGKIRAPYLPHRRRRLPYQARWQGHRGDREVPPERDPSVIEVNSERALYWLGVGAQPSEPVAAILKVTGDWQKFKGEPAPPPMLFAEERRDKTARFNDALRTHASSPAPKPSPLAGPSAPTPRPLTRPRPLRQSPRPRLPRPSRSTRLR